MPSGLAVCLYAFSPGTVSVPASGSHLVSVHVGPPVHASCRCDGTAYRRLQSEGDIDFVPAGFPGYWEDETPAMALAVRLPAAFVDESARASDLAPKRLRFAPRFQFRDPAIEHVAWAMKAEIESERPAGCAYMEGLCRALAARLVNAYADVSGASTLPRACLGIRRLKQITTYIDARLDESLTCRRLAAVGGLSESHFKAAFRAEVGVPVHRFVMERRVERARTLIAEGDLPLAQVALEAGFAHQSHLARWLRRIHGVTPRDLRRRAHPS